MNSLYPLMEKQEEQEGEDTNLKLYIFSSSSQVVAAASSSSSSQLAFATCFSTSATQHGHQRVNLHHHLLQESHHQLQHDLHQAEKSIGGSREDSSEVIFSSTSLVKSSTREALERSRSDIDHQEQQLDEDQIKKQDNYNGSAAKYWMSSKMRLMQKMMINTDKKVGANSDHQKAATRNNNNQGHGGKWEITGRTSCNSNGHNNNNGVRVCSDCNTTTTPLWRSGPQGPKSLCNACGIRQRKARRAMVEAANGGGGGTVVVGSEAPSGKEVHKEKKSRLSWHGDGAIVADHVKNKCNKNMTDNSSDSQSEGTNDGVSFDRHNFTLRLSKSGSAFGRAFPRDEEEAAILLMELSCGLVHTC